MSAAKNRATATPAHTLAPKHAKALRARGITPDVSAARACWTATAANLGEVKALGHIGKLVTFGPALMLPVHDVRGRVAFTVMRPDTPRKHTGKLVKYETPRGAKLTLDVPPAARPHLGRASVALWITESQLKADALVSAGATCVVALLGVWGFRGKAARAALKAIKLKNRTVYLVFDSDAQNNPQVMLALKSLRYRPRNWSRCWRTTWTRRSRRSTPS